MSSSVFERTRALHADVEELHERLLDATNKYASTSKDRILLDHELKQQFDELLACKGKLLEMYEDADGSRAAELRNMTGGGAVVAGSANEALWTTFYESLSQIRMYHAKFPTAARLTATATTSAAAAAAGGKATDAAAAEVEDVDPLAVLTNAGHGVHFSAEEAFGERVDMHALYERYINLPQFNRSTDYLAFLASLPTLGQGVPRERKLKASPIEYRRFVSAVLDYLADFHQRTNPLVDVQVLKRMAEEEFDVQWNKRTLPGWFDEQSSATATTAAAASAAAASPAPAAAAEAEPGAPAAASSASDSAAPPAAAAAPAADASNPLFCVACAKLFGNENTFKAHLPGKKHKKNEEIRAALQGGSHEGGANGAAAAPAPAAPADGNASAEGQPAAPAPVSKLAAELRSLALLEFTTCSFAQLLSPALESTRMHLLKKQTRTFEELAAELAATEADVLRAKQALKNGEGGGAAPGEEEEDEEDDAHAPLYNPLNLPLGFDGKPIPYWLYKLHGLNLKFNCEICGDFSYAGPRNFERHFTEWRHAYGMRALGIPNTRHFAHITKMADAQALFEKLKREGVGAGFKADEEEEMEDAEGNVFNKRTFMELQRQGLV